MEAAFRAGLAIYQSADQGEFRGREGSISIPAGLDGLITGVLGLDQRRMARRKSAPRAPGETTAPMRPADLEAHYHFPAGDCAGQTVAIAEFGSPLQSGSFLPPAYFPDDVSAFCESQGRPVPNVTTVPVNLAPLTLTQVQALPPQLANLVLDETGFRWLDFSSLSAPTMTHFR